jgi:hypothetical protein
VLVKCFVKLPIGHVDLLGKLGVRRDGAKLKGIGLSLLKARWTAIEIARLPYSASMAVCAIEPNLPHQ